MNGIKQTVIKSVTAVICTAILVVTANSIVESICSAKIAEKSAGMNNSTAVLTEEQSAFFADVNDEQNNTQENTSAEEENAIAEDASDSAESEPVSAPTVQKSESNSTKPANETVKSKDVIITGGTRGGTLAFHTDKGTYDLYVPQYYLSTNDIPALKILLKLKGTLPKETQQYITTENGYDAVGPTKITLKGDTYKVSGNTLTFGNKKTSTIEYFPDWGELPYKTPAATATASGLTVTFIIEGGDGKYDCPVSTFRLTPEQCRSIGLKI